MTLRLTFATVLLLALATATPLLTLAAQAPTDPATLISRLSALEYPTRTGAARLLRRVPAPEAVAALTAAIRTSSDQFVRYRALVLLTGFNDRETGTLMRGLLMDRNDRVREVAYRWLEQHPDPALADRLLASLETEQAEFVRPALIRALSRLTDSPAVRRALTAEAGRGLDFFRTAVIEALGLVKAGWALAAITDAAKIDGPLQDDAIIALGRIGAPESLAVVAAVPARPVEPWLAAQAARCLLGDDCPGRLTAITEAISSRLATRETVRAGVGALAALALGSDTALSSLTAVLADAAIHDEVAAALGGVALRAPDRTVKWLESLPSAERDLVLSALHEAFDRFEEDYAEEQFYASARAAYWSAADGSATRMLMATLIERLEF